MPTSKPYAFDWKPARTHRNGGSAWPNDANSQVLVSACRCPGKAAPMSRAATPREAGPVRAAAGPMCQNDELSTRALETDRMSSELIKHITDDSFSSDVLESKVPVLVDYWAEWCGPCKMIAPILDELSKDYGGRLQIAKMNVDDNREVPAKFGIRGIPTLMLFKGGELAATKVGALSKAQLAAFLDGHL